LYFSKTVILAYEISLSAEKFILQFQVKLMKRIQQKKQNREMVPDKKTLGKMPVFNCPCGAKILIVPDLGEMNKAIENHLAEHKKITGQSLTEELLAQEILMAVADA
jgi:hypothetical protein